MYGQSYRAEVDFSKSASPTSRTLQCSALHHDLGCSNGGRFCSDCGAIACECHTHVLPGHSLNGFFLLSCWGLLLPLAIQQESKSGRERERREREREKERFLLRGERVELQHGLAVICMTLVYYLSLNLLSCLVFKYACKCSCFLPGF